MLYWLKFHREIKLFDLFKSLFWKTISNFLLFLEELIWENKIQNNILYLFKPMQAFAKEIIPKWFILNKDCIAKGVFENEYQRSIL
jgi:hypothetical protein